jgi:hypothetical protein
MDIKNLEVDHTYLLRLGTGGMLTSVTIMLISETAYHCRWNSGIESKDTWEHKDPFHSRWTVIEDITKLMDFDGMGIKIARPIKMVSTKLITCHVCKGFGVVPDSSSTAGGKTCPACNGDKMIPEVITLTQEEV